MGKVECKITLPEGFHFMILNKYIDAEIALEKIEDGKLVIFDDDVFVDDGIIVYISLKGTKGMVLSMDVFIDGVKNNTDPIYPKTKKGKYVFTYPEIIIKK